MGGEGGKADEIEGMMETIEIARHPTYCIHVHVHYLLSAWLGLHVRWQNSAFYGAL